LIFLDSLMTHDEVMAEFRAAEALLEGHFILSSGLHSARYLQCARVLKDPRRAERLCTALAARIPADVKARINFVIAPAMGGLIAGYEMARTLGVESMFAERVDGRFVLRRGFDLPAGAGVFMMEDIITTGLSSAECIAAINSAGGTVVAAGCLIDRLTRSHDLGVPVFALAELQVPAFDAAMLPPELAHLPAVKPGSRGLAA
jgi:orotate phosphoribosyltransferase